MCAESIGRSRDHSLAVTRHRYRIDLADFGLNPACIHRLGIGFTLRNRELILSLCITVIELAEWLPGPPCPTAPKRILLLSSPDRGQLSLLPSLGRLADRLRRHPGRLDHRVFQTGSMSKRVQHTKS